MPSARELQREVDYIQRASRWLVDGPDASCAAGQGSIPINLDRVQRSCAYLQVYGAGGKNLDLLERAPVRLALLTTLVVSARRSSHSDTEPTHDAEQECYDGIRHHASCIISNLANAIRESNPAAYLATARTLIRTDTLQVYSRLLAQRMKSVTMEGGGMEQKRRLHNVWTDATSMLCCLMKMCSLRSGPSSLLAQTETTLDELYAALAESAILEHLSQATLYMVAGGFTGFNVEMEALHLSHTVISICNGMSDSFASPDSPRLRHLRTALSGRCVQHLLTSQLVATLCAADGGPSYGLPQALLRGLSLFGWERDRLLVEKVLCEQLMASARMGCQIPSRLRPLPTFQLLLRTARMATASMQPQQQRPLLRSLPLQADNCGSVACTALTTCRRILSGPLTARAAAAEAAAASAAAAGAAPAAAAEASGSVPDSALASAAVSGTAAAAAVPDLPALWLAWWRQVMELCGTGLNVNHVRELDRLLTVSVPAGPLPAAPAVPVAAALAAGVMPWMERALRRCSSGFASGHANPHIVEALAWLLHISANGFALPMHLLAFGEPRAAAALVATLGKLLRCCADRVARGAAAALGSMGARDAVVDAGFLLGILPMLAADMQLAFEGLTAQAARLLLSTTPSLDEMDSPSRQLVALLSYALVCWLPPLADLALADSPALRAKLKADDVASPADKALTVTLSCFPPLLHGFAQSGLVQPTDAAKPSCPSGDAAPSGWRSWLLQEARAVEVVEAALQRRQEIYACCGEREEPCSSLALCCSMLAAAFPSELRASTGDAPGALATRSSGGCDESGASKGRDSALYTPLPPEPAPQAGEAGSTKCAPACAEIGGGGNACHSEPSSHSTTTSSSSTWRGWLSPAELQGLHVRLLDPTGLVRLGSGPGSVVEWLEARSSAGSGEAGPGGASGSVRDIAPDEEVVGETVTSWEADLDAWAAISRLLPTPDRLRALLPLPPACDNPRCASLEGDSEAGVRLRACKGCGAARYCCRECQVAHWRSGHREACGKGSGG